MFQLLGDGGVGGVGGVDGVDGGDGFGKGYLPFCDCTKNKINKL